MLGVRTGAPSDICEWGDRSLLMQSGHDATKAKQPVPKWVPMVLVCLFGSNPFVRLSLSLLQLGISTVALSVPIVLLRRQRAAQALNNALPPRRRTAPSPTPRANPTTVVPAAPRVEPIQVPKAEALADPGFNGVFYSAKAFGIATTFVTIGAFVGVWAVRTSLGVQNVRLVLGRPIHRVS